LPHIVNNKKEILFQFYLSSRNTYVTSPQTSLVTVVTSIVLSYFRDCRWNQSYPQISNESFILGVRSTTSLLWFKPIGSLQSSTPSMFAFPIGILEQLTRMVAIMTCD